MSLFGFYRFLPFSLRKTLQPSAYVKETKKAVLESIAMKSMFVVDRGFEPLWQD